MLRKEGKTKFAGQKMSKQKPVYSGESSKGFWKRINAFDGQPGKFLYSLGCILQDAEHHALLCLEEAERERTHLKRRVRALTALTAQAQRLNMGYGPPARKRKHARKM
jgi:hypothetical protein